VVGSSIGIRHVGKEGEEVKAEVTRVSQEYERETQDLSKQIDRLSISGNSNRTQAKDRLASLEKLAYLNREAVRKVVVYQLPLFI
jgi:hypothetical protein